MTVWLNGTIMEEAEARIGTDDRGFLLGDGVFETMRLEAGTLRRWDRHLARLRDGVTTLGIAIDTTLDFSGIAAELARRKALESAVIRLTVTRGPGGRGLDAAACEPTILVTASPLTLPGTSPRLLTLNAPRRAPLTLAAHFKMLGYGDNVLARRMAQARGGDMAVMLSPDGRVACADSANLFWITGRTVFTPALDTGALAGTTRAAILDGFAARGLHVEEDHFRLESLASAEAVIVTNAVLGAVPALSLDGHALKTDIPLADLLCEIERNAS